MRDIPSPKRSPAHSAHDGQHLRRHRELRPGFLRRRRPAASRARQRDARERGEGRRARVRRVVSRDIAARLRRHRAHDPRSRRSGRHSSGSFRHRMAPRGYLRSGARQCGHMARHARAQSYDRPHAAASRGTARRERHGRDRRRISNARRRRRIQQERLRLEHCLDRLEPQQKSAIREAFFTGATYSELAQRLAVPLGTMKSWIRRSLMQLKTCLEQ
ncbi:protein of unknown function (plasmid) [Caballeronia sp. S22]